MQKMIKEHDLTRRVLAFLLAAVMFMGYVPVTTRAETEPNPGDIATVADPETLTRPEDIYGNSTLNAGKVTVGKSVNDSKVNITYAAGKTQSFTPAEHNFIVTMSQTAQVMGLTSEMATPVDVVFVLDTSSSMDSGNKVETMVEAANAAIETLLSANPLNRVGVVAFSGTQGGGTSGGAAASVLTYLGHYDGEGETNHIYWVNSRGDVDRQSRNNTYIKGRGTNAGHRAGTSSGTNIHAGVALGGQMLANATETAVNGVTRMPFLVVMSDGQPSYAASGETWYFPNLFSQIGNLGQAAGIGFLPALTAAYYKGLITEHYYGNAANATNRCYVYTMGLGLAALDDNSENLAYMTMDPTNTASSNTYYDVFVDYYDAYLDGEDFDVTTQSNGRNNYEITEASISATEKYVKGIGYTGSYKYNDDYFDATDADDLGDAFTNVVSKIQEKSISSPTHVSTGGDHNFEGYVTFTDPIGEYMEVKNIRGILADGYLYQGATFAQKLASGSDSEFNALLASVLKKRMSMTGAQTTDAFINSFLASARNSANQASYVSNTNFDNSIVWWGSRYDVGEEDEDVQILGHADNDTVEYIEQSKNSEGKVMVNGVAADYVCRSYFFYGTAGGANPNPNEEYMYLMVRVQRELTAPYKETVVISIPASLLSVDEVLINEKTTSNTTTYTADVNDVYPLRVVYEVGLRSDINAQNVDSVVSDAYRAEKPADSASSVNYDPTTGTYYFFTNDWNRAEDAGSHHRAMAKATFDAAADNSFYTYQEDTLLLNEDGTPFTGSSVAGRTLYYEREVYSWGRNPVSGTANTYTATKSTQLIKVVMPDIITGDGVKQVDGKWYISKGVYTASTLEVTGDDTVKNPNDTHTSEIISHAHRTGTFTNSHYTVLLGNNGKLSLVREPAKSVSINGSTTNDDGKTVMVGDTLTYTIKVSNADNAPVEAVVTDSVPRGTKFVANLGVDGDVDAAAFTNSNGELTWTGISVPAKGAVNVSFQVMVTADALSGANDVVNIDNTATIKLGSNPAYSTNKVTNPPEGKKVVNLAGEDIDGKTVKVGDVLVYRIRVQSDAVDDNGTPVQSDIVVTDRIPAGTTFKTASHGGVHADGTVTWSFTGENQLAANASVVLTLEVYVDASAQVGSNGQIEFPNQAKIVVGTNDPKVTRETNEVINYAEVGNISITKDFDESTTGFADKEFNLTLTETGHKLNGEYAMDGGNADKITFNGGVATTTIKKGQTITIKGIPVGATVMVAETLDATTDPGWSVSGVNPTSGSYTIAAADEAVDVTITNQYAATPVEFQLMGKKTVDDANFPDGTFTFRATQVNFDENTGAVSQITDGLQVTANATVTNGQDVEFVFSPRVFTEEGIFYYIVDESSSTINGVHIDATQYLLKLVISDENAQLEVTSYIQSNENADGSDRAWTEFDSSMAFNWLNNTDKVVFHNTYTPASTSVPLFGTKTLNGREMKEGEFSFQLIARDGDHRGQVVAAANNDASGKFSFEPLTFTEADMLDDQGNHLDTKVFRYAIREAQGPGANVTYDNTYYEVTITVTDNGGELNASTVVQKYVYSEDAQNKYKYEASGAPITLSETEDGNIDYVNVYHTQDVSISLSGVKTLTGAAANGLKADEFTFEIVEATVEGDKWTATDKIVSSGANGAGADGNWNEAAISFADITYSASLFDSVAADGNGVKTLNFYYIAMEVIPADTEPSFDVNMKYASELYKIKVQVELNTRTGIMTAQIAEVNGTTVGSGTYGDLDFTNIKNPATASVTPVAAKTTNPLNNGDVPAGLSFSFTVRNAVDGSEAGVGVSDPTTDDNSTGLPVVFTPLVYDHEDVGQVYYYWIYESNYASVAENGVTYDPDAYLLKVDVVRNGNNAIVPQVSYYGPLAIADAKNTDAATYAANSSPLDVENNRPLYENTYEAEGSINLTALKSVKDSNDQSVTGMAFDFKMVRMNGDEIVEGSEIAGISDKNTGVITFGTINFGSGEFPDSTVKSKDVVYMLTEIEPNTAKIPGIDYDKTQYRIVITLTHNDAGSIDAAIKSVEKLADRDGNALTEAESVSFSGNNLGVTFENPYAVATGDSVTMSVEKKLETATGRKLKDNEFSFQLHRWTGTEWTLVETATNKSTDTATNTGTVSFVREYPATISSSFFVNDVATFVYRISEIDTGEAGIVYDPNAYYVKIQVTHDQSTASLIASDPVYYAEFDETTGELSDELASVTFRNTYTVKETYYAPQVAKILNHLRDGKWVNDLTDYDKAFSFELVEVNDDGSIIYVNDAGQVVNKDEDGAYAKVIATANNGTDGQVYFAEIPYTAEGTHFYMIREAKGSNPNITYNQGNKVVYLKVAVTDNVSVLTPSVEYGSFENGVFTENKNADFTTFTNYYGPHMLNLDLNLLKEVKTSVDGSNYRLKDSEFDFNVYWYDANEEENKGDYVTSGSNNAAGAIIFGTIQITQADFEKADTDGDNKAEFKFLVEEQGSGVPGITVDKPMVVTVTVEDKGYGNLIQTGVTYEQDGKTADNTFTNTYSAKPATLNLVATKTLVGKKLNEKEFTFILTTGNNSSLEIPVNSDGNVPIELRFDAPGTYEYTLREKTDDSSSNYTYDTTVYTIKVVVTDDGKGQLHAVATITTPILDSTTGQPVETTVGGMSFVNTYTPDGIEKDLTAQIEASKSVVDVEGNMLDNKNLAGYTFKVEDANGNAVKGKDGETITGISGADGKITFAPVFYFPAEGEYHYYISEIDDGKPGYEYDSNVWAVHILVRYNKTTGELYINDEDVTCAIKSSTAQQDDASGTAQSDSKPVFVNVYKPDDTSVNLVATKVLNGRDLKDGEFTFHLMRKDTDGNYSIIVSETTNDASGKVNFHITYSLSDLVDEAGKRVNSRIFEYELHEDIPDDAEDGVLNGVTFDSGKKTIRIKVTDEAGKINAYVGDDQISGTRNSGLSFVNKYEAQSVDVPIMATKILTDGDISKMAFTFELLDSQDEVIQTVSSGLDGLVTFKPLTFTQADMDGETVKEFVYKIREKAGNLAAVTYDETVYTVTVTVTDNLIGNLHYAVNYSNEEGLASAVFNNIFDSAINDTFATIQATKSLTGKDLTADAFTFELVDKDGVILEAKNDSKGNVSFTVPYTEAGTYTYTLREKAGTDTAMSYDDKTYQVDVDVTAGDDGRLVATVTYKTDDGEAPEFRNVYTPSAVNVTLTGTKELSGRKLVDGEFKFQVHDSNGKEVATGANDADGKIVFEEITFAQTGSYLLTVTEVDSKAANITYDTTKFTVGVVVTNVNGVLQADVTYEKDIEFSNVYTPEPTEPPTEAPTNPKPGTSVDTGDHTQLGIPVIFMVISLLGILVVLLLMKSSTKGKYTR